MSGGHIDSDDPEYIDGEDLEELSRLFVGRRIVSADVESLTLDDGTVLDIRANEGCGGCWSGWYELERLSSFDNVITGVRLDFADGDDHEEVVALFVYAEGASKEVVTVSGNEGSGYYGRGFRILASRPSA